MDQITAIDPIAKISTLPQLAAEHFALDTQLKQLNQKKFLTSDEEMEEVRLKKQKLHLKDMMAHMVARPDA